MAKLNFGAASGIIDTVKVIGVLIAIILVLYFISKIIADSSKGISNVFGTGGVSEIKKAMQVAENEGQSQYYNDATIKGYSDSIYTMLEHGGFWANVFQNDDEDGVLDIMLKMRTTGDVTKLAYYLKRDYGLSLQAILRDELPEYMPQINDHFQKNGITFTL